MLRACTSTHFIENKPMNKSSIFGTAIEVLYEASALQLYFDDKNTGVLKLLSTKIFSLLSRICLLTIGPNLKAKMGPTCPDKKLIVQYMDMKQILITPCMSEEKKSKIKLEQLERKASSLRHKIADRYTNQKYTAIPKQTPPYIEGVFTVLVGKHPKYGEKKFIKSRKINTTTKT